MARKVTENKILSKIYSLYKQKEGKNVLIGPGDDCAAVKLPQSGNLIITTDGLVEGTHFVSGRNNAKNLARKLVRVNLSDLAAMGNVKPLACVCDLGIPASPESKWINDFARELFTQTKKFNITLCGGNIAKSKTLHLYLTVFGTANNKKIIKRTTANTEDLIYGVGNLGHSKAGIELIKKKVDYFPKLVKHFWEPEICLNEARIIADKKLATAMLDNSDGLYQSVRLLSEHSGSGFIFDNLDKLVSPSLKKYCSRYKKNAKDYVLYGGEDYGLIFTVKPENEKKLLRNIPKAYKIGKLIKKRAAVENDKENRKIFSHF